MSGCRRHKGERYPASTAAEATGAGGKLRARVVVWSTMSCAWLQAGRRDANCGTTLTIFDWTTGPPSADNDTVAAPTWPFLSDVCCLPCRYRIRQQPPTDGEQTGTRLHPQYSQAARCPAATRCFGGLAIISVWRQLTRCRQLVGFL